MIAETAGPTTSRRCPGVGRYTAARGRRAGRRRRRAGDRGEHPPRRRAGRRRRLARPRGRGGDGATSGGRCAAATGCSRSWTSARWCAGRASRAAASARSRRRCATRGPLAGRDPHAPGAVRGQLPPAARRRDGARCGPARRRVDDARRRGARVARRRRPRRSSTARSRPPALSRARRRQARTAPRKLREQGVAGLGEDRLGVELHALDRELAVAQAHHQAVLGLGGDLEHVGHGVALDDERVVAGRGERARAARRTRRGRRGVICDVLPCITCGARTTVAAEELADALVPEAHAEHGHAGVAEVRGSRRSTRRRLGLRPGLPGPGDTSTASGSSATQLVERRRRRGGGRPARRRAPRGTARGCRRTSRSCRSRAPAPPASRYPRHRGTAGVSLGRWRSRRQPWHAHEASRQAPQPTRRPTQGLALHAARAQEGAKPSQLWVPVTMFTCLVLGVVVIAGNYLELLPGGEASNNFLLIGLVLLDRRLRAVHVLPLTPLDPSPPVRRPECPNASAVISHRFVHRLWRTVSRRSRRRGPCPHGSAGAPRAPRPGRRSS